MRAIRGPRVVQVSTFRLVRSQLAAGIQESDRQQFQPVLCQICATSQRELLGAAIAHRL